MRDGSSGDFGTVATLDRKRDAEAVAAAMNYAYARGEANGLVEATESAAEEVNRTLHSLAEELDALASRLKR
jgi:flagellar biosynthesis/type III secretory pathway protein FliH